MKFKKYMRFNEPYWFNGIYKIVRYTFWNGGECKPYYQAYYLTGKNWGDYVNKSVQCNKKLTFKECVKLCEEHTKSYQPCNNQIKQAEIARESWIKP